MSAKDKTNEPAGVRLLMDALRAAGAEIAQFLVQEHGLVVQTGPFAGMQYVNESIGSSLTAKLLGSYEANLHPIIDDIIGRAPAGIINIGSGEGYYAVGLARRIPDAQIHAFESNPAGQRLCPGRARSDSDDQGDGDGENPVPVRPLGFECLQLLACGHIP